MPISNNNENRSQTERETLALKVSTHHKNLKQTQKINNLIKPNKKKKLTTAEKNQSKRVKTYLLFFIYHLIPTICLILSHFVISKDLKNIHENHKSSLLIIFIIAIGASFILSGIVTFLECFQKIPLINGILYISLVICTTYIVVYIGEFFYFEQMYCSMIVLSGGSFGLFVLIAINGNVVYSLFTLLVFNIICSGIAGFIMCYVYRKNLLWSVVFSSIAFLVSEFNIYTSQTKINEKKSDKPPEIISQPFEFVISIFKIIFIIIQLFWTIIKKCLKTCETNENENQKVLDEKNEDKDQEQGQQGQEGENNKKRNGDVKKENNN